jgi:hypothetical protein
MSVLLAIALGNAAAAEIVGVQRPERKGVLKLPTDLPHRCDPRDTVAPGLLPCREPC